MENDIEALEGLGRNRSFLIYTMGNAVSLTGTWMQRILVGWLTWELTGSGTWLGLVAAADLLPTVVIAPLAGAVADRWKRLTVAKFTQTLGMFQALTVTALFGLGLLGVEMLFLLTLVNGTITAMNLPARLAMVHSLVGKKHVPTAVAINSLVLNTARLLGPMAAGAAIVSIGIGWGFFLNALSFGVFLLALMLVQLKSAERPARRQPLLQQIGDGIQYTLNHRGIASVMLIMLVMGLGVRPISELLPGYVDTVFSSGAGGLVALTSAQATGAICGAVLMARLHDPSRIPRAVMLNNVGMALAVMAFIFVPNLVLSLPAFALVGFFMVRASISAQTYVQLATREEMRGRVLSLHGMNQRGSPALGALMLGAASDFMGFRWPVVFGCALLLTYIAYVAAKGLLRDLDHGGPRSDLKPHAK